MKNPRYAFSCNLLVEPPKIDRFYMDMRVYNITSDGRFEEDGGSKELIWRGIYLAFDVGQVEKIDNNGRSEE